MFTSVDTRQMQALVDYRQTQVVADAQCVRTVERQARSRDGQVGPVRVAIGVLLMRAGAKIAGAGSSYGPHLRPGV